MKQQIYYINPVPKPRMTQRDAWKKRPVVVKYHAFCDEMRANHFTLPESGAHLTFVIPMPKSWSKKKRIEMNGKPHQQRPDVDNLIKAALWTPSLMKIAECGISVHQSFGVSRER